MTLLWLVTITISSTCGHKALTTVVSLSVCPVPDYKSRMVGLSMLKSGRKEAHDTGGPWLHLEIERSKVKVIRSCRQSDACSPITLLDNENSQKHRNWQEGCRVVADLPYQFQGQNIKGQGHQAQWRRNRGFRQAVQWTGVRAPGAPE